MATDEAVLLDYAMSEADEFFSSQVRDEKELAYLRSLTCSSIVNGCEIRLDLVQSVLLSISSWCDSKLHDYHLHFSQVLPSYFIVLITSFLVCEITEKLYVF